MGIFDRLRGVVDEKTRIVANDLERMDEFHEGLGDKAVAYVLRGEDATCLASISNRVPAQNFIVGAYGWGGEVALLYRQRFLFKDASADPHILARYGEVLAALKDKDEKWLAGTQHAPTPLRCLLTDIFRASDPNATIWRGYHGPSFKNFLIESRPDKPGMSLERLEALTLALGAELVDIFDLLLHSDGQWFRATSEKYLELVDFEGFAKPRLEHVLKAGARVHAAGRVNLMRMLAKWGVVDREDVISFMFNEAGAAAAKPRETAISILSTCPAAMLEPIAIEKLRTGNANERAAMVSVLAGINSEAATTVLKEQLAKEKTAKVKSAIEAVFTASQINDTIDAGPDDTRSYAAIDGARIDIPMFIPAQNMSTAHFGAKDVAHISAVIAGLNAAEKKRVEELKATGNRWARYHGIEVKIAHWIVDAFNGKTTKQASGESHRARNFLNRPELREWRDNALAKLSLNEQILVAYAFLDNAICAIGRGYWNDGFTTVIDSWISGPDGDFRQLIEWDMAAPEHVHYDYVSRRNNLETTRGSAFRAIIREGYLRSDVLNEELPAHAMWPYFADQMCVLDEAFGLQPVTGPELSKLAAVRALKLFPKTPMRYFPTLLEIATGPGKRGRKEAQDLLEAVEGIDGKLIDLLDDGRQDVRSGVAQWLGARGAKAAVPAIKTRLKKEKSELARAAMLSALEKLGENLDRYLGPKALIAAAESGAGRMKFDKLDWLAASTLGNIRFKGGDAVPEEVLKYWIYQAFKLKQPSGNKLFEIYLDQLKPESAESFSSWIFNSWIAYDTAVASDEEANAYAQKNVKQRWQQHQGWLKKFLNDKLYANSSWVKELEGYTEETVFDQLRREIKSTYLNSGAASKGVLGLATRAPSADRADRVRAYLKDHGSRTSQATALLELMAACADPVSLQVVISASTRLKQKSVQARANELLQAVAEDRNWTMDELSDRTIPTAGFDDGGVLELPCTPLEKLYTAVLDNDLKLIVRNPDGKTIQALPSGDDEFTKTSKKALSSARKQVKQVVSMQGQRLYEALCAERSWVPEDWDRDFRMHPLMRHLVQRLVWLGVDRDGVVTSSFRPTAEGDLINQEDEEVELDCAAIRIAHGALLDDQTSKAWIDHMKDYEIKPLFQQFGRSLRRLPDDHEHKHEITDRVGWLSDAFTIRGIAVKLGYERGEAQDGGWFGEYSKTFKSAGVKAVIAFTGNSLPEENVPAAIKDLYFEKLTSRGYGANKVKLAEIPPVLLLECWNDYHALAQKGRFDQEWEKKAGW